MVDPYIESLNKYAYPPLSYNLTDPNNQTQLTAKLCEIALMEGWHDHNDILNTVAYPNRIRNAVIAYTPPGPPGCDGDARYHSEEKYLTYVLTENPIGATDTKPSVDTNWKKGPSDALYMQDADWQGVFNERIREKYVISRVVLTKNEDTYSRVQKCFNDNGIKKDIYILRDVAYGCWADDIARWGKGTFAGQATEQYIYNVQTSSGIYDPGPSLSYFSGAGERCGYRDTTGKSRYGLFDCSFPGEIVLNYPAYIPTVPITCAEQLIYTKYKCTLFGDNTTIGGNIGKKVAEKMIESAAVNLIVEVPVLDASGNTDARLVQYPDLYLVTKHNSQKASSLFDLPLISSCIKYSARKDMIDIASNIYRFEEYNVITGSSPLKIMTKKFGDSGIAIQTLRPKLNFYEFEPQADDSVLIQRKESNGIHAFLTFDQVAAAAAIEYGAPIVIYNTHDYAIIFISKTMKTAFSGPIEQLKVLRKSIKDPFPGMDTDTATNTANTDTDAAATAANDAAAAAATAIEDAVNTAATAAAGLLASRTGSTLDQYIRTSSKSDIDYGLYLSFWYKLGPFVKIYNDTLKTNTILNNSRGNIIASYNAAKTLSITTIAEVENIINGTNDVIDANPDLTQLMNNLTIISNGYRDYNTMTSSFTSVTTAFSQVTESIRKLMSNPKTIKIGDVSKIIDNCDPFKGTVKEQRVRKLFTCLRGQSPSGIELGITVVIQIYENVSGSPPIQDGFKEQIRNLFENIAQTCKEELKDKLRLAFDFIPPDYRDTFVSERANPPVNPNMNGGRVLSDNSLSSVKSLSSDNSNNLDPAIATSIPNSSEKDSQMFSGVIDKLTEIITFLDKDKTKDRGLLKNMKPLLEATKDVIEIQGTMYTKTLNRPLSYEHLEADTFIHQPLFIFSVLQTILEYNSAKAEPQVLNGGDKKSREMPKEVARKGVDRREEARKASQKAAGERVADRREEEIRMRRGEEIIDRLFDTRRTRSATSPYRRGGVIEGWLANYYPQIGLNLPNLPSNYTQQVFLLNTLERYNTVNVNLNGRLVPGEQYVVVYGYVIDISSLIKIIKGVAINSRSVETKNQDEADIDDKFDSNLKIIIDDVTTSSSIVDSILVRNDRENDDEWRMDVEGEEIQPNLFDYFVDFTNTLREDRVQNHAENVDNSTNEHQFEAYEIDLYNRLITQLRDLTLDLQTILDHSQTTTNVNELLTTIFPTTFVSTTTTTGGRHKKTRRKQKKPITSKYKKTRRKRAKSKGRQTKKRILIPKVRKPRKTRP